MICERCNRAIVQVGTKWFHVRDAESLPELEFCKLKAIAPLASEVAPQLCRTCGSGPNACTDCGLLETPVLLSEPQGAEARNCTRCNAPQAFDTQTGWFRTKYCWTDPDAHLGAVRA